MKIKEELEEVKQEANGVLGIYKEIISDNKKTNKRMFIIALILLGMLLITNLGWLYFVATSDIETYYQSTEDGGDTSFIRGNGVINNGETENKNN